MKRLLAILILLTAVTAHAYTPIPGSPLDTNARPRVWIDAAGLAEIVTRTTTTHTAEWANVVARADTITTWHVPEPDDLGQGSAYTLLGDIATLTLVARVKKEKAEDYSAYLAQCEAYATNIIDEGVNNIKLGQSFTIGRKFGSLSIIFDWLHDDLTTQMKQDIHDYIVSMYPLIGVPNSFDRKTLHGSTYWGDWGGAPWWSCAALYGDGLGDVSTINDAMDLAKTEVDTIITPFLEKYYGMPSNAWGYMVGAGAPHELVKTLLAWETMTGEAIYGTGIGVDVRPLFMLYGANPTGALTKFDDTSDEFANSVDYNGWGDINFNNYGRNTTIPFVQINQDTLAAYIASQQGEFKTYKSRVYSNILFNDKTVSSTITWSEYPTDKWFSGHELLTGRAAWDDVDSLYYTFRNRDNFGSHIDVKQNSFTIFLGDTPLAIDSGTYPDGRSGEDYMDDYHRRTISSSTMLVYKPNQTCYRFDPCSVNGGQKYGYYSSNQGTIGLVSFNSYMTLAEEEASDSNTADSVHEIVDDYSYVQGDATRGYPADTVNHFTREWLHIKGTNYFVIYDRVDSVDAAYRKSFLLQTITEPVIDGTEDFTCSDSFDTTGKRACQGDTTAGISESIDSTLATVTNETGRLFQKTLFPPSLNIRKVGGAGYRFWVDYNNFNEAPHTYNDEITGSWRLEISPTVSSNYDEFLHVLEVADSTTPSPVTTTLISTTGARGALIEDPTENIITMFSSDSRAATLQSVSYTTSPTTGSKHIVHNMVPNSNYTITANGVSSQAVTSSAAGIVMFDRTETGSTIFSVSYGDTPVEPDSTHTIIGNVGTIMTVSDTGTITNVD